MNDLAQELADQVIDWVADENVMHMCICSLVCKRWLHRTRYRLFSKVLLITENLRSFIDLVESSSLPILSFIRHLELRYNGNPVDNALLARAQLCPNLTRIRILITGHSHNVHWLTKQSLHSHLHHGARIRLPFAFGLVLHRPNKISVGTLTRIVSCFPNLDTLRKWRAPLPFPLASNLGSIQSRQRPHASLLPAHLPCDPNPQVLEFSPPCRNDDAWAPVEGYFQHAGKGLRSLKVGLIYPQTLKEQILQYTPNLENLAFRVENPAELLEVLQSLHISNAWIAIEARVDGPPVVDNPIPWNTLDTLLAEPQFLTLKRFVLDLDSQGSRGPTITSHTSLGLLMPLANARGILSWIFRTNIALAAKE
ncbi:hypothetical protein B0H17DRAFT_1151729 [Mycena rosella]|uniref:F-box domain-containing protein n=1 Tax=Mycena rosella TaxID=1033263 RepID=A0AAD7BI62_MYCRO|nr:hypothetical protein B0H17DRAFT_1151729 [Mycena rosella]